MNLTVNKDVMQGKWKQMRGKVKKQWGKLTDNQLDKINGSYDELAGLIQVNYGYSIEKAKKELDVFLQHIKP